VFEIVLHEPEIPNNTGNIGRTCVATGCKLHLVHPLGFETDEKALRRSGLDYWPRLDVTEHRSFDDAVRDAPIEPNRVWCFTSHAAVPVWDATFRKGDVLLFGKESKGLPREIVDRYPGRALVLPMMPGERSLNLSTSACAVIYEGLRQLVARGDAAVDIDGRIVRG
jgi:tRNA (cytidine/uridine-2'-O-)-methyltransferase